MQRMGKVYLGHLFNEIYTLKLDNNGDNYIINTYVEQNAVCYVKKKKKPTYKLH